MKLVFIENNRPLTDSLSVAEAFGKEHKNVMRDISNQIDKLKEAKQTEFVALNFERITYRDGLNREQYKYLLTEDAFAMVTMAYTTVEAMIFKVQFIKQFNDMKMQILNNNFKLPQTFSEALRLLASEMEEKAIIVAEKIAIEAKVEADRPLVLFAESLQVSSNSILVNELAKLLKQNGIDTGEKRLYRQLREEGYLMSKGERYNLPTQRSMDMKIMEIKVGTRSNSSEGTKTTHTTKITGKGQFYFINKFKNLSRAQ